MPTRIIPVTEDAEGRQTIAPPANAAYIVVTHIAGAELHEPIRVAQGEKLVIEQVEYAKHSMPPLDLDWYEV